MNDKMEEDADDVPMFAPAYTTKRGYTPVVGRIRRGRFFKNGEYYGRDIGRDVFRDISDALKASEQLRIDRIASLKKSLAKIESVGPHYP